MMDVVTSRQAYECRIAGELERWDAEINRLENRVDIELANVEDRYYRVLKDLRCRREKAQADLSGLRGVSGTSWEQCKAQMDKDALGMVSSLSTACEQLP